MRKKIKYILPVIWMIIIFYYSNQPAEISNEKSKFVINLFNLLGLNLNGIFGEIANFVVRKVAHFMEYFILYIFIYNSLDSKLSNKKKLLFSLVGVFIYASSDELHQYFVPGRSSAFRDVIIDTSGGLLALMIMRNIKSKVR